VGYKARSRALSPTHALRHISPALVARSSSNSTRAQEATMQTMWMRIAVTVAVVTGASVAARAGQATDRPRTSSIAIPPAGEPGVPLTVEGRVLLKGGAPASSVDVYVYQTDARGYYSPDGRDERNPRLKGYLRTDDQGRYQVRTIRPGPYPNSGPPAHIHYEVTSASGVQRFELVFEGDQRLTDAIRRDAAAHGEYTLCTPAVDAAGAQSCRGADIHLK
jgi:protocatechuate 3,4-dioxygenase beta subunit